MATIGSYYLPACSTAAKARGVDTDSLMAMAGISPSLHRDGSRRIADTSMAQLLNLLVRDTEDAFLGFANRPVPTDFFPMLLKSLAFEKDLAGAIDTLRTAFSLVDCQLTLTRQRDEAWLAFSHRHVDPAHFLLEYLLVFLHRLLSWLAARPLPLLRAEISYLPSQYRQEFTLLFRCPLRYRQPHNRLVFDAELLTLPLSRQHGEFLQLIDEFPLIILRFPGEEQSFSRQVSRLLMRHFAEHQRLPEATEAAAELGCSTATLRRKLAAQLTSFGQLKTEFRKAQAMSLLQHPGNTIEVIATILGYSEARAFSRVFKHWTGLTPSRYRQLL